MINNNMYFNRTFYYNQIIKSPENPNTLNLYISYFAQIFAYILLSKSHHLPPKLQPRSRFSKTACHTQPSQEGRGRRVDPGDGVRSSPRSTREGRATTHAPRRSCNDTHLAVAQTAADILTVSRPQLAATLVAARSQGTSSNETISSLPPSFPPPRRRRRAPPPASASVRVPLSPR